MKEFPIKLTYIMYMLPSKTYSCRVPGVNQTTAFFVSSTLNVSMGTCNFIICTPKRKQSSALCRKSNVYDAIDQSHKK